MTETQAPLFSHHRTQGGFAPSCPQCNGKGQYGFNHLTGETHCYRCLGTGRTSDKVFTYEQAVAREARAEKARQRREEKRQALWEAGRAERERNAQEEALAAAAYKAELATWSHLEATVGETVTVTGTIATAVNIDGYYGVSRLVVVETEAKQAVSMFTTASWAFSATRGDSVTITGTVKSFGEYEGRAQTVLAKPKLAK